MARDKLTGAAGRREDVRRVAGDGGGSRAEDEARGCGV